MSFKVKIAHLTIALIMVLSLVGLQPSQPVHAANALRISQVYGGGGNSGATYKNDFIELFNSGNTPIDLNGWSVQYGSAAGTTFSGITNLNGIIPANSYYLIKEGTGGGGGTVELPTPDATGGIAMSATVGKVALVQGTAALSGGCADWLSGSVDFVGYGSTANCYEDSGPTPAPSNTTAVLRAGNGCTDTDNNAADFTAGAPTPRNSGAPTQVCSADSAPTVISTVPAGGATGVSWTDPFSVTFSEPVAVTAFAFTLNCTESGLQTLTGTPTDETTFSLAHATPLSDGESCTATVVANQVTDLDTIDPPDAMVADYTFAFTALTFDPTPTVVSVSPLAGATDVPVDSSLSATFSEEVSLEEGALTLTCGYSGVHTVLTETSDNLTYRFNPDVDFSISENCTAKLNAALVRDSSDQPMAADYTWAFKTYYDPDVAVPIAVARAAGVGWTGTVQGNLTLLPGTFANKSFSVQDETGGLYIYPASTAVLPTMILGDVMSVKGTINNYNGLLEFDPVTKITWVSSGTLPVPLEVATGFVAPTQGKLISVTGTVTWTGTPPAPGGANFTYYLNDGSGQVSAYNYKLTGIDMRGFTSGQQMKLIGISGAHNGAQIQPRSQADVIDLRAATILSTEPIDGAVGVSLYKPISVSFSKAMDPATLDADSFTLVGPSGLVSGTVSYGAATNSAVLAFATPLEAQSAYTATLTADVRDANGTPIVEYFWQFTTGDADTTTPTILSRLPDADAADVAVDTPIEITFSEELAASTLTSENFVLSNSYGNIPTELSYDSQTFKVTLTPTISLLYSTQYTVTVKGLVADYAGNTLGEDAVWNFTTMEEPPMQIYYGDLHNHTSYSDGAGTPSQALAAGEAAGFDFMAISDHSYAISDGEWDDTLAAVTAATDESFVGLRGFEYTQGAEGHINVWNTTRHATRSNVAGCTYCDYTPNLEAGSTVQGFYGWLNSGSNVPLDSAGEAMQFNHPGWINFNDWFYHPEVSDLARLEEVGNGNGSSYVFSEDQYIRSLDYGWKLGATNNADTHTDQWGINTDNRTGVLMPELTKTALLEALYERRTFSTEDKNASLSMKANGAWMGSEIANTGQILFEIQGADGDGETAQLVQLMTDQGKVAASTAPSASDFSWEPQLTITSGVHYYYVKVTQADGDRIVTSPIWTIGSEDVSITDLRLQPTIPTTHNPTLVTVRVTNRVATSRTVSVGLEVNGDALGLAQEVLVPANGDNVVNFTWQPAQTGTATLTAVLSNAPAGDNPDDNTQSVTLEMTDQLLPLILIDAGHGNLNTAGDEMRAFVDDLAAHHYNVLKNLDALTAADLNPEIVKLLIITAPQYAYSADEQAAIANYVAAGGGLWMGGLADYTGKVPWADTVADRENAILSTIETITGQQVNMRVNDDEVIDGNNNNGYVFGVIWRDFPSASSTGIGMNVENLSTWSLNSIVDRNFQALTAEDTGVQIVMQGDLDEGYTGDSYHNPFHTSNTDADGAHDAYLYNPTWNYPAPKPEGAIPLPGAAVVDLEGSAGRIMLYGDSNDPFTIFAYTAGDGKQNELFNLESVMWLLGEPIQKSTIAQARAQAVEDQPDNLNKLVWVEGEITAAYGEFFNVLTVQDATGGITVHAPAGDIDAANFTRGTHVRVIGTVGSYNGDTEIEFFEAEMVQVITGDGYDAVPLELSTAQAGLETNEGWLVYVSGTVVGKSGTDALFVDDCSGSVRVFLDGYNGNFSDIHLMDRVRVTGLASEDGDGARIRVRNHNFHVGVADDVSIVERAHFFWLPVIGK